MYSLIDKDEKYFMLKGKINIINGNEHITKNKMKEITELYNKFMSIENKKKILISIRDEIYCTFVLFEINRFKNFITDMYERIRLQFLTFEYEKLIYDTKLIKSENDELKIKLKLYESENESIKKLTN
jgi:hypothetical protein